MVIIDELVDGLAASWSAPFALRPLHSAATALPGLRQMLEALLSSEGFDADLSSLPEEELRCRVLRGVLAATEGARARGRSSAGAAAHAWTLAYFASCHAHGLNREELNAARVELQTLRDKLANQQIVEEQ